MSTVVQTRYGTFMEPGIEGMISEMTGSEVGTRICETAAGIGFGRAVSQGTAQKGCVVGGANFIGLTVRDITLALAPVDPLSETPNPLDVYGVRTNVAVMSRGHMWVKPQAVVVPGEAVYYEQAGGRLSNSASGTAASGWVRFASQPAVNSTLVINGATLTFVASGATGDQANIGSTLGQTIRNAVAAMNASATAGFAALTFAVDPSSPLAGGDFDGDTILVTANAVGTAGNALALTSGPTGMTKSGATLSGGTAAATLITGAKWIGGGIGGQLAIVSLGIQQ